MPTSPPPDPFDTRGWREQVLAGWARMPARFREDANAEEDAVRGGYRDRLLAELLQNAHDAALEAGVPGRVLLRCTAGELRCANTGAPLTSTGMQALSTLRASPKTRTVYAGPGTGPAGRFGSGFASTLTVTDEPLVVSGAVAVGWSLARTLEVLEREPALAAEVLSRGGAAPVLRLPFAVEAAPPPEGYDTEVRLPLRAGIDAQHLLEEELLPLLLFLDGLTEVVVEGADGRRVHERRTVEGGVLLDGRLWLQATAEGPAPADPALPVEARRDVLRAQAFWPADGWPPQVPRVLHAPTPSDEALSLPVLLSAEVPMESQRRRSLPGATRRAALEIAAAAVAELAHRIGGPAALALVPVGLAGGEVDAELRESVVAALRARPPVPALRQLGPGFGPALAAVHALLATATPGLLPLTWPVGSAALRTLGVEELTVADAVDLVNDAGRARPAPWWREVYVAFEQVREREPCGGLRVPLAAGGFAAGPRGLLVPDPGLEVDPEVAARLSLAHPDAVHPLLFGLGAEPAGPRQLLAALRQEVEDSYDSGDLALAGPVLALVAAAGLAAGELPWLGGLTLTDTQGEPAPAEELVIRDSPLDRVLDAEAPLGTLAQEWEQWGKQVLAVVGVAGTLVVVRGADAVAGLDGGEEFLDTLADPDTAVGVRDLEWLRWPAALPLLESLPVDARPYARWWCSDHPVFGAGIPDQVLGPGHDPALTGIYETAGAEVPEQVLHWLGCRVTAPTDPDGLLDLLDRLGDPGRTVERWQVRQLLAGVASALPAGSASPEGGGLGESPPLTVRAVDPAGRLVVVAPADAVLVDAPDLLPLVGGRPVVPAPLSAARALAPVLGVPLASTLAAYPVVGVDPLTVAAADGTAVTVAWRLSPDGRLHAADPEGEGRGRAWRDGRWEQRHAYVARLRAASDPLAALEDDLEDLPGVLPGPLG